MNWPVRGPLNPRKILPCRIQLIGFNWMGCLSGKQGNMTVPEVAAGSGWPPALFTTLGVIVGSLITGAVALTAAAMQHRWQIRREFILMHRKWIDDFRERVAEIIEIAGWFYVSKTNDITASGADSNVSNAERTNRLKLVHKITQVELMLDWDNKSHVDLAHGIHDARTYAFSTGAQLIKFEPAAERLKVLCSVVLTQESKRLNGKM
jgi:hypothetical protein